jgi:hypothetical protein
MAKATGTSLGLVQRIWRRAQIVAAPPAHFQALARPQFRRQADRHRRALRRSAGSCGGALG